MESQLQIAAITLLIFAIATMYYHREGLLNKMRHVNLKDSVYGIPQKFTVEGYQCDKYNAKTNYPSTWYG